MRAFERVKKSHGLIARGAEVGLDASVGFVQAQLDKRVQSCTMNSHRLVLWVTETFGEQRAEQLYEELNRRHFLQAGVLNDRALLVESLGTLQLSESQMSDAIAFLDSGRGEDQILALYDRVTRQFGIHSIPTLVVDGRYTVSGAQTADEVLQVLLHASDRHDEAKGGGERLFGDIKLT